VWSAEAQPRRSAQGEGPLIVLRFKGGLLLGFRYQSIEWYYRDKLGSRYEIQLEFVLNC
jgi:hypothetical protein